MNGDIASWDDANIWETAGEVSKLSLEKKEICSRTGSSEGIIMLMPPLLNWFKARDLCRRFNGRLHIDNSAKSVRTRSFPLVEKGETFRPQRCRRVWLGASDLEEEGVWRDSETNEVLDLRAFWGPGQPNGVRVQNCAGIWELVILLIIVSFLE